MEKLRGSVRPIVTYAFVLVLCVGASVSIFTTGIMPDWFLTPAGGVITWWFLTREKKQP